jgi:CDP-glucose 4,6-dehydratase
MAAQSLVLDSYKKPIETFVTNVIGTANLIEAARYTNTVKAIINVTSDKCYENQEIIQPYKENDRIGGSDPYSSSKACAELITNAYRKSFFLNKSSGISIASVRAGNVIGGGDWAANRLIPDFFKSLDLNKPLLIRHPNSIRPWQHVLDPINGYLILSKKLVKLGHKYSEAWNFGPNHSYNQSVLSVINIIINKMEKKVELKFDRSAKYFESRILNLDTSKAKKRLNWSSKWNLDKTLEKTVDWYKAWKNKEDMKKFSIKQIHEFYKNNYL